MKGKGAAMRVGKTSTAGLLVHAGLNSEIRTTVQAPNHCQHNAINTDKPTMRIGKAAFTISAL